MGLPQAVIILNSAVSLVPRIGDSSQWTAPQRDNSDPYRV